MKSIFLLASAGAFAFVLCGCAPELDQTGLSPEEKVWAENIKANYGAWEIPESVPRGVRRDDLANAQSNESAAPAAVQTETVPVVNEPAVAPVDPVAPDTQAATAAAPVAPVEPAAAPAAEPEVYTVVKGDSLGAIARKFYGRASAWKRIQEANKDVLKGKDKTLIRPGMKLQIPRP